MHQPPISRRRALACCTAALGPAIAGCTDGSEESAGDGMDGEESELVDATVTVGPDGDTEFVPEEVEVAPGSTVKWVWASDGHTVSPRTLPNESDWTGVLEPRDEGYTYTHTFDVVGAYQYLCDEHPGIGYAILHVREDTSLAE